MIRAQTKSGQYHSSIEATELRLFDFAAKVLVLSSVPCSVDSMEVEALDISTRVGSSLVYSYFASLELPRKFGLWQSLLKIFRTNEVAE